MKKILKSRIFAFVLGALIFGSIGVVSAYTILAKDVGYTPKDSTWKVDNVKDAIDELYNKTKNDNNIKLSSFNNEYITENIFPSNYESTLDNGWYFSRSSINYNFDSNDDFEISIDIDYKNTSANMMGGPTINFYLGNNEVGNIQIYDSWGSEFKTVLYSKWNNTELNNGSTSNTNCSGKYSVVRKNNSLNFYQNSTLLNSINFDENIKFDKIEVAFRKYPNYSVVNSYIKKIYIGNIINY